MTNKQADQKLTDLKKDRAWLSEASGYKMSTLYNAFSGEERELGVRMNKAFQSALVAEEAEQIHTKSSSSSSESVFVIVTAAHPQTAWPAIIARWHEVEAATTILRDIQENHTLKLK